MKYLSADKWWWLLPIYLLGGLALGLADPLLGRAVRQLGFRPGLATAASVNLLLPFLVIVLSVACPRPGIAWLGALTTAGACVVGLAVVYPPAAPWDAATLLHAVSPVLVLACVGYVFLATVTALVTRAAWK